MAFVILLAVSVYTPVVHADIHSTYGTEFTFAYFPTSAQNVGSNNVNDLYISSLSDSDCTLSYYNGSRTEIKSHIPAGAVGGFSLPDRTEMNAENKIGKNGIYISCTDSVGVYAYNQFSSNHDTADSYTILPHQLLATKYLVPTMNNNPVMGVVAATSNTVVTVHLQSTCTVEFNGQSYNNGDVMKFTLDKNDVLQIVHSPFKCRLTYDCDFSGTIIESTYPTAVFAGSVYYYPNGRVGSHLLFQVPPLVAYSTNIIVPHVSPPATDMNIRVLGSQDNTAVAITAQFQSVSTSHSVLKHRWDIIDFNYTASTDLLIKSDKPVMVIQNAFFPGFNGALSMFIPGIDHYESNCIIRSFGDGTLPHEDQAIVTMVSETSHLNDIRINGQIKEDVYWQQMAGSNYSIGTTTIKRYNNYNITSTSPLLIRLHQYASWSSYGFIAGYSINKTEPEKLLNVKNAVTLQCLPNSWFVAVDLKKLSLTSKDIPNIYLGTITCTGSLRGDLLIFNVTYDQCNTEEKVSDAKITFKNSLWHAPLASDNVIIDVQWVDDLTCSHSLYGTDSVHIYPKHNTSNHASSSGEIHGTPVHISLYKDASFHNPFAGSKFEAQLGQPVYVQVQAPGTHSLIMIIKSCHAHVTKDPGSTVSHPLISQGCPASQRVQLIASRNQETRFKFDMFTLPSEDDGIYVTCDVTFCSMVDFSPQCQLGCHTNPDLVGK